ncbi:Uracil-DNA glycosylase [Sea otter poxvirus]|uniref:Uracil-DNA glycosylase n=1 Tax=Sea otter poxvirus TaxID=1416741 RepID=A0A2U9QHQ0_9POXV|nr:Uracil-DNA glycosylase [Sea otter poxvirus]AWU47125.1 Uracil-DNA glycosylase [Sea otter poxvirus]
MKEVSIPVTPFKIIYHEDWDPIISQIVDNYIEIAPWVTKHETSPPPDKFFVQLQEPLKNKRLCICGIDPYPQGATGVPFESRDFSKKTIRVFAEAVSRYTGITEYNRYDIASIPGVLAWNMYLSCKVGVTKSHAAHWDNLSRILLQYITKFISVLYCLGKVDFCNIKSKLNSPVTLVIGYHPAARNGQFLREHTLEIINVLLKLNGKLPIDWSKGFIK